MAINIGIATSPFRESFQYAFDQEIPIVKENPSLEEITVYDLIIFSGGADIHPRVYGENITYSRGINNKRDEIEIDILSKAMLLGIKVFGVCRGHQLINAYLGGRLIQDLFMGQKPGLTHSSPHSLTKMSSDRFLDSITIVNSLHHQGVISPGKGLKGTSSYKKVIESTVGSNIYSVQFHPEFMLESEEIKKFFRYFKNYVKNNESKKDPKTVSISDIKRRSILEKRPHVSTMPLMSRLESRVRASYNIEQFIHFTRELSSLSETSLELRIVPEHEIILRNLYAEKDSINSSIENFNSRDEEIYERMDEGVSDEEFEEMEQERIEISDMLEERFVDLSRVNSHLVESAINIVEAINQGGWNSEGMEIPNNREEDSERPRAARVFSSEEESVPSPSRPTIDLDLSSVSSTTVTSGDIDWSFVSDSDS